MNRSRRISKIWKKWVQEYSEKIANDQYLKNQKMATKDLSQKGKSKDKKLMDSKKEVLSGISRH